MKKLVIIIVLTLTSAIAFGQTSQQVLKDSLSITKLVGLGQKIVFNDYDIKFKKVITDSRCPKNVMCVRAGEAFVLVSIYKNSSFIADKELRIDASGYVMETNNLAFDIPDFKIYGFSLTPYPEGVTDVNNKAYQLEIVFKPKVLN